MNNDLELPCSTSRKLVSGRESDSRSSTKSTLIRFGVSKSGRVAIFRYRVLLMEEPFALLPKGEALNTHIQGETMTDSQFDLFVMHNGMMREGLKSEEALAFILRARLATPADIAWLVQYRAVLGQKSSAAEGVYV